MNKNVFGHGGNWAAHIRKYGRTPLDFSANINPLGMSEHVKERIAKALDDCSRYPDPDCTGLRRALAGKMGVDEECFFFGNGAADIIYRIALGLKPNKAMVTAPGFSEYEDAVSASGGEVVRHTLSEEAGFSVGSDFVGEIETYGKAGVDMIFLCEPNNPTGVCTDKDILDEIIRKTGDAGIMLVIDQCFRGFLDEPGKYDLVPMARDFPNLIIIDAFTKTMGMPGIRLGYGVCCDGDVREKIDRAGPPWRISHIAEEAGIAALEDEKHISDGRKIVRKERNFLLTELKKAGITGVYGEANYLLFRAAEGLKEKLEEKDILIRDCSNYHGLSKGWYRIAVRTHSDNMRLLSALSEIDL